MNVRHLRILLLLLVLLAVVVGSWLSRMRTTDWDVPLWVAIYPANADGSTVSDDYIEGLSDDSFGAIEAFMRREAERYGVALDEPVRVKIYHRIDALPPVLDPGDNFLQRALWSLRLRWWAWRAGESQDRAPPDIRMFVLYHDPAISPAVPHSLGLQKGLLGVVHAFADHGMSGANNIVIAHELLHTLGASDKYDPVTSLPTFPYGYADPGQVPLYPQERAEVMAGRLALSASEWEMPDSLHSVVVGPLTAAEIRWVKPP